MSDANQTIDHQKIAAALDAFLQQHKGTKYLVMGEDHKDEKLHFKMLSDPNVIRILHKYDLNTTAIELPAAFQRRVDDVMWHGLSPEKLIEGVQQEYKKAEFKLETLPETYTGLAELIKANRMYGSPVVVFDGPHQDIRTIASNSFHASEANKKAHAIANRKIDQSESGTAMGNEETLIRRQARLQYGFIKSDPEAKAAYQDYIALRMNPHDEAKRAEHVKMVAIGGAVILTGDDHGAGFRDFDEFLGDNAIRLSLVPDRNAYYRRSQVHHTMDKEKPEGYLILSEGKIISGDEAYRQAADFAKKMASRIDSLISEAPVTAQRNAAPQRP